MASLRRIEIDKKIGYKDDEGNIVIKPIYDEGASHFQPVSEDEDIAYASVLKNGRCGIIDNYGNEIIPFAYEEVYYLSDNLFAVRERRDNKDWALGVINKQREIIIPFVYKEIRYTKKLIQCFKDAYSERIYTHCYMDYDGRVFKYSGHSEKSNTVWYNTSGKAIYSGEGEVCANHLLIIEKDGKQGVVDFNGKTIIQNLYIEINCICKDRFIVGVENDSGILYGVVNDFHNIIVELIYSQIEEHQRFFKCTKYPQENEEKTKIVWKNKNGVLIHEGDAFALSDCFLCISNGVKYGVINQEGKRIINYLYDKIILENNLFIVLREDKIGLYDLEGNIILDTFCNSIESVVIENNNMLLGTTTLQRKEHTQFYPGYCKEFYFDPNGCLHDKDGKIIDLLYRKKVSVRSVHRDWTTKKNEYQTVSWCPIDDANKPMIISTDINNKMIFLKSEGIIPNSKYDDIQQITQNCYVVKKDNLFGVYRIDTKTLAIPVKYESIRFYGGHTVLVCKDGLWGAQSIEECVDKNRDNINLRVSIPTNYLDIKILDDKQLYYCCKEKSSYSDDCSYILVNTEGDILSEICDCDSQFIYYNESRILKSKDGKFGFYSIEGFQTIPFKYDEIIPRSHEIFDVRIGNRWGLLSLDGRELSAIKYKDRLPNPLEKNIIVMDAESDSYGLLSPMGIELIPTIYEHLLYGNDNLYFYGYGGHNDCFDENFFSDRVFDAKWGVVNTDSKHIIEADYDCYFIQSHFILAGRDGDFACTQQDLDNCSYRLYHSRYNGVFDLYTKEGELLFGGFNAFHYDEPNELFIFCFGGKWESPLVEDNSWMKKDKYDIKNGFWLILNKEFKTVIRYTDGRSEQFEKGFIADVKVDVDEDKNCTIDSRNIPYRFIIGGFKIAINAIIINNCTQAVDIETGEMTNIYSRIYQITPNLFFYANNNMVGITNIKSEKLIGDCLFITYPRANYFFVAKRTVDDNYSVLLYNLEAIESPLATAIDCISEDDLINFAQHHNLDVEIDNYYSGLKSIILSTSHIYNTSNIFNTSFLELVTINERKWDWYKYRWDYCFHSIPYTSLNQPDDDDNNNPEYEDDYSAASWEAMTEGMYGDMPEGFNGDYDFLG